MFQEDLEEWKIQIHCMPPYQKRKLFSEICQNGEGGMAEDLGPLVNLHDSLDGFRVLSGKGVEAQKLLENILGRRERGRYLPSEIISEVRFWTEMEGSLRDASKGRHRGVVRLILGNVKMAYYCISIATIAMNDEDLETFGVFLDFNVFSSEWPWVPSEKVMKYLIDVRGWNTKDRGYPYGGLFALMFLAFRESTILDSRYSLIYKHEILMAAFRVLSLSTKFPKELIIHIFKYWFLIK